MFVEIGENRYAQKRIAEEYGKLANAVLDSFVVYIKSIGEYYITQKINDTSLYEGYCIDQREYYALSPSEEYQAKVRKAWGTYVNAYRVLQDWFRSYGLSEIRFNEAELAYALTNEERWDYYHSSVVDCIRKGKIRTFARIETKFLEIYHFSGPPGLLKSAAVRFGEYDELETLSSDD